MVLSRLFIVTCISVCILGRKHYKFLSLQLNDDIYGKSFFSGKMECDGVCNPDNHNNGESNNWIGYSIRKYRIVDKLGEGASACVYKVKNTETMIESALKISKNEFSEKNIVNMAQEVKVLKAIEERDPENRAPILKMEECFMHEGKQCMIFPLMGKTLASFMENPKFRFSGFQREHIQRIGYQIFQALHFLHQNGISHRDLKSDNIMFTNLEPIAEYNYELQNFITDKNNQEIRLIDVGLARFDFQNYNDKDNDIWDAGLVLFKMWCGEDLFFNKKEIVQHVLCPAPVEFAASNPNGVFDASFNQRRSVYSKLKPLDMYRGLDGHPDPQFLHLIRGLLEFRADMKNSASFAMQHPYFEGMAQIYGD